MRGLIDKSSNSNCKKCMDSKTKKVLDMLDESARLQRGEWTLDGRKLFKFKITKIEVHSSYSFDDESDKFVPELHYTLSGKGILNAIINVHKMRIEPVIENAIGILDFYPSNEEDEKDGEEADMKIFLSPEAFENFTHTVAALSFKGEFILKALVMETEDSEVSDSYLVKDYLLENVLKLTS